MRVKIVDDCGRYAIRHGSKDAYLVRVRCQNPGSTCVAETEIPGEVVDDLNAVVGLIAKAIEEAQK